MWLGKQSPHCIKGLTFRPDAEYLQLPSNQTLVSSFPGAMSRAVALNHLATALMGLAIVFMFFCLKPDEGWSYWSKKLESWANFIAWLAFWFDLAYIVVLRDRISNNDTGFDFHLGNAFWLMLYTVLHRSFLSYQVQTNSVAKT